MDLKSSSSKCSVKWDVSVDSAKHVLKSLGINFLANVCQELNTNNTEVIPKQNTIQLNQNFNNHIKYDNNYINLLSDELLLKIFGYLSLKSLCVCSQVSKPWNRVGSDSSLWKNIDLSKSCLNLCQLVLILNKGVNAIRLSSAKIIDTDSLDINLSLNCIQYLDLSMAQISVNSINSLLDLNFDDISLKKLSLESLAIDQKTLDLIVGKHKELEVLNISMVEFNDSQCLHSFSAKLPETLIELNASSVKNLNIKKLIECLPKSVKSLNISQYKDLKDEEIGILVNVCPFLVELDLSDCHLLTKQSLESMQLNLNCLESLHINRCQQLTELSVNSFKMLKTVSIRGISFFVLRDFIDRKDFHINHNIISTIARPKPRIISENYSTVWEIPLRRL